MEGLEELFALGGGSQESCSTFIANFVVRRAAGYAPGAYTSSECCSETKGSWNVLKDAALAIALGSIKDVAGQYGWCSLA